MNGAIGKRYARALFALAKGEGKTDEIGEALSQIAQAVQGLVASGAAASLDEDSRRRLARRLAEYVGGDSTLGRFLQLVVLRGRLVALPQIYEHYQALGDAEQGRVRAEVTSARPLEQEELGNVIGEFARVTGRTVLARVETDAALLGGLVVEIEGRVFDGSVRTALARLADRMARERL